MRKFLSLLVVACLLFMITISVGGISETKSSGVMFSDFLSNTNLLQNTYTQAYYLKLNPVKGAVKKADKTGIQAFTMTGKNFAVKGSAINDIVETFVLTLKHPGSIPSMVNVFGALLPMERLSTVVDEFGWSSLWADIEFDNSDKLTIAGYEIVIVERNNNGIPLKFEATLIK